MQITHYAAKMDVVCDYIPFVSTVTNLIDLFLRTVYRCCPFNTKNIYWGHITHKKTLRCLVLLIPIWGNLVAFLSDYESYKWDQREYDWMRDQVPNIGEIEEDGRREVLRAFNRTIDGILQSVQPLEEPSDHNALRPKPLPNPLYSGGQDSLDDVSEASEKKEWDEQSDGFTTPREYEEDHTTTPNELVRPGVIILTEEEQQQREREAEEARAVFAQIQREEAEAAGAELQQEDALSALEGPTAGSDLLDEESDDSSNKLEEKLVKYWVMERLFGPIMTPGLRLLLSHRQHEDPPHMQNQ